MTDPRELIAAANLTLPAGWSLAIEERRRYAYRSLWRITASHDGHDRLRWDVYRVGAALPAICERVQEEADNDVVVTTDAAGWIKRIEEGAA